LNTIDFERKLRNHLRMTRLFLTMLLFAALVYPAQGQTFGERIGNSLRKFGQNVERTLEKGLKLGQKGQGNSGQNATNAIVSETPGQCLVYDPAGTELDNLPCREMITCQNGKLCDYSYIWPSGGKTVVRYQNGTPIQINGRPLDPINMAGNECVKNSNTGKAFCFVSNSTNNSKFASQGTSPIELGSEGTNQNIPSTSNQVTQIKPTPSTPQNVTENDIAQFFASNTFSSLAPINALPACETRFVSRTGSLFNLGALQPANSPRNLCQKHAELYGRRIAEEIGAEEAQTVLGYQPTLAELKRNDWFRFNEGLLTYLQKHHHEIAIQKYFSIANNHIADALQNAKLEVANAFKNAAPLTDDAEKALALCGDATGFPRDMVTICNEGIKNLNQKISVARCDRALQNSGASKSVRSKQLAFGGQQYRTWTVAKVICDGANTRPDLTIKFNSGFLFSADSITILNKEGGIVLDVDLEATSPRDDRGFIEMLWDIASGENEKPATETYWVTYRKEASPEASQFSVDQSIGCVLGFIKCS